MTSPSAHLYDASNVYVGDYSTIQDAVNAAGDGYKIQLDAGAYAGAIDINGKALTITGANAGADPSTWAPGNITTIDRVATDSSLTIDGVKVVETVQGAGFVNGGSWEAIGFVGGASDTLTVKNSIVTIDASTTPVEPQGFGFNITYDTGSITIDHVQVTAFHGGFDDPTVSNYGAWINGSSDPGRAITITNSSFDPGVSRSIGIAFDGQIGGPQIQIHDNAFGAVGTAPGAIRVFDFADPAALTGPVDFSGIANNTFADHAGNTGLEVNQTDLDGTGHGVSVAFGGGTYAGGEVVQSVQDAGDSEFAVTLTGTTGRDILTGSAHDDSLSGGDGSDLLIGNGGADTMDGGQGNDTYYADSADTLVESVSGAA